jgi:hypothetical protein
MAKNERAASPYAVRLARRTPAAGSSAKVGADSIACSSSAALPMPMNG